MDTFSKTNIVSVSPLFNIHVTGTLILFVTISRKWPAFLNKITDLDENFARKYKSSTNMRRNIIILAIIANVIVTGMEIFLLYPPKSPSE